MKKFIYIFFYYRTCSFTRGQVLISFLVIATVLAAGYFLHENMNKLITNRMAQAENSLKQTIDNQMKEIADLKKIFSTTNEQQNEITKAAIRLDKMDETFQEINKKFDDIKTNPGMEEIKAKVGEMEGKLEEVRKKIDEIQTKGQANEDKERLSKLEDALGRVVAALPQKPKNP